MINNKCHAQKNLESIRKQSRQHQMIINDHRQKKAKALEAAGVSPDQAQNMAAIGQSQNMASIGQSQPMAGQWQHGGAGGPGMVHVQRSVTPGGPQVCNLVYRANLMLQVKIYIKGIFRLIILVFL